MEGARVTCQRDGRGPLDVVVEGAVRAPVAAQEVEGGVVGKVLELHQHVRAPGAQRPHERAQHPVVGLPREPPLPQPLATAHRRRGQPAGWLTPLGRRAQTKGLRERLRALTARNAYPGSTGSHRSDTGQGPAAQQESFQQEHVGAV